MAKKALKKTHSVETSDILAPTIERSAHDAVERLADPIADTAGRVARPYRAIDILAAMERRGAITAEMHSAGDTFRDKFNYAHLDTLRAASLLRSGGCCKSPSDLSAATYAAREHVWRAICAVGGLASAGGACLWHVVGLESSLKQWAAAQGWSGRMVSQEMASGILIAALGALEAHYSGDGSDTHARKSKSLITQYNAGSRDPDCLQAYRNYHREYQRDWVRRKREHHSSAMQAATH